MEDEIAVVAGGGVVTPGEDQEQRDTNKSSVVTHVRLTEAQSMFDTKKSDLPSPTESTWDPLSGKRISVRDMRVKINMKVQ